MKKETLLSLCKNNRERDRDRGNIGQAESEKKQKKNKKKKCCFVYPPTPVLCKLFVQLFAEMHSGPRKPFEKKRFFAFVVSHEREF